jgi:hypothetical protein
MLMSIASCFRVIGATALMSTICFLQPSYACGAEERVSEEKSGDGCDSCNETHWTLELNRDGKSKWVKSEAPTERKEPEVRRVRGEEAEVNVNCRTTPTNTSGRKTCGDDEVHHLPAGWVFAENEVRTVWHSDIGSSNTVNVTWEDYVEVIPNSGYRLPRTMRVHGHARSGGGFGERGHTNATVYCRYFSY